MTVKYVKQQDRFRCGPVAIINAMRWAGKDVSYKKAIPRLTTSCKCKSPKGTKFRPFIKTLRKEGKRLFKIRSIVEPLFCEIEDALLEGDAVVWNFKGQFGRHYALIVDMKKKTFGVANFGQDYEPLTYVSHQEIEQIIEQDDRFHRAWVITKLSVAEERLLKDPSPKKRLIRDDL